jgi:myosin heavy subunit
MKALFYVLAFLVTGAAGYFSYENLGKFEQQKEIKLTTIETNTRVSKSGDEKQADLDKEKAALDAATKDKADAEASIENLVDKEKTLRRDLVELEGTLEEQQAKFADLKKIQDQVIEMLKGAGEDVTLDNLAEQVAKVEEDKKEKTKQLGELESLVGAARKVVTTNQAEIGRLADRSAARDSRIRRNAMESVVSAVNDDWGFVVIAAGSSTGFTPQTKLLVKRDGRLIAELQPSSIERTQTIAEIDLKTVAPGARIQPGDRVILANPATN